MTIYIVSLIVLIVVLLYVKRKITEVTASVETRMNKAKNFITHPSFLVSIIGRVILMRVLGQLTRIFRR